MIRIKDAAEDAVILYFIDPISPAGMRVACEQLQNIDGLREWTPAYQSILVYFKPKQDRQVLKDRLQATLGISTSQPNAPQNKIIIPVYYHKEVGLDLVCLSQEKNLSVTEIITLHSQKTYQVYAVGFAPAFAYLGTVNPLITMPRLDKPRPSIAAGSVGIANDQTAVYPVKSTAGWNIIGRTPLDLSLQNPNNLKKFTIGDTVQFTAIDRQRFLELGGTL